MGFWGTAFGAVGGLWGGPAGAYAGSKLGGAADGGDDVSTGGFGGSRYGQKTDAAGNPVDDNYNRLDGKGTGSMITPGQAEAGNTATRENAFEWGGDDGWSQNPNFDPRRPVGPDNPISVKGPNGAQKDIDRYRGKGDHWGSIATPGIDYSAGNRFRDFGDQSRTSQGDALGLMRGAAFGTAPSVAQIQQQQGMGTAMANQIAMAASARGASGLAQAQYNAAGNVAGLQRQASMDGSMLRAKEMQDARAAYMGGASAMRDSDMQGMGMMDQRAHYGGDLEMRNRDLRFRGAMGYDQMAHNVASAQLGAQMGKYGAQDKQHELQVNTDARSEEAHGLGAWVDRGIKIYGITKGSGGK